MKLFGLTNSIQIKPTLIQHKAWKYLIDKQTNVILFGGAAGVGKTYLGCLWLITMCLQYPGTVWGATRARLIDFQKSTQITLLTVLKQCKIEEGINYSFDRKTNIITFFNGSKIFIFDSYLYPTDPNFDRLGSMELTGCLLDEASQISKKGFEMIRVRLRYKHQEYGLIPKILIVTNPTLNFIKSDYYEPFINGTLEDNCKVILGLVDDNPYIDSSYKENLLTLSGPLRSRMLYGDWNYADNDESIFSADKLVNVFYNSEFFNTSKTKYLTCDVAASGKDKTVITVWEGLELIKIESYEHKTIPQIFERIKSIMNDFAININNVIIDRSGVGTGLNDLLKGSIGFIANASPTDSVYKMIKDELYYKLAEYINNNKMLFSVESLKDEIVQELGAHTMFKYDQDNNKTQILPKDKVKALIGRSPDLADAIMMRMYFETKSSGFEFSYVSKKISKN